MKKENGITLIALVVTIVVLVILGGVSVYLVLEQNGIIARAQSTKTLTEEAQANEQVGLAKLSNETESYISNNRATSTDTGIHKTTLYDGEITESGTVTLKDNIKNYSYIMISVEWRAFETNVGTEQGQYFYDTDTLKIRDDESTPADNTVTFGYSTSSDFVQFTFLKDNKCKFRIQGYKTGGAKVNKIVGIR